MFLLWSNGPHGQSLRRSSQENEIGLVEPEGTCLSGRLREALSDGLLIETTDTHPLPRIHGGLVPLGGEG